MQNATRRVYYPLDDRWGRGVMVSEQTHRLTGLRAGADRLPVTASPVLSGGCLAFGEFAAHDDARDLDARPNVISIPGTLDWSYQSKVFHTDPSAGRWLNFSMTTDPSTTNDRPERWESFAFGPWSDILGYFNRCQHFM